LTDVFKNRRAGFISIIGAPNTGKSTLLNTILKTKISIVTPKAQTTRSRIIGIHILKETQLIFIDTPGLFSPKRRLDRAMVSAARESAENAEIVLYLVDSTKNLDVNTLDIIHKKKTSDKVLKNFPPIILVLNKIDIGKKEKLLGLTDQLQKTEIFSEVFMISALNGDGVKDLLQYLAKLLPKGPWLYPSDQLSNVSDRFLAAEITREKLYLQLHQELPYAATIETENWQENSDGSIKIDQVVYVERASQKAIVIGKGGKRIKSIGAAARQELERTLGCNVHLFLFVKVSQNWGEDPERYKNWELTFDS